LFLKVYHLNALNYTSDLFQMLQMSRSWYEKGIFFSENTYGGHAAIHNYFLIFAFSPFTFLFGAKGFFIGWTALLGSLVVLSFQALRTNIRTLLLFLCFILGPYSFWLFDDPVFGFHLELCYAPLALLLFFALENSSKKLTILSTIALILVREEGAMVAACVFLAQWSFSKFVLKIPLPIKSLAFKLGGFFLVFIASLAWLKLMSMVSPAHPAHASKRVLDGINNLLQSFSDPYFRGLYFRMLKYSLALPIVCMPILFRAKIAFKLIAIWTLLSIPFIAINYIAAGSYFPSVYEFGLTWPYRAAPQMGLFWGLLLLSLKHIPTRSFSKPAFGASLIVLFSIQMYLLKLDRGYDGVKHMAPMFFSSEWQSAKLTTDELKMVQCFSSNLPPRSPIATSGAFFALFEESDLVWPNREQYASAKPLGYLCHEMLEGKQISPCFKSKEIAKEEKLNLSIGELQLITNKQNGLIEIWQQCFQQGF